MINCMLAAIFGFALLIDPASSSPISNFAITVGQRFDQRIYSNNKLNDASQQQLQLHEYALVRSRGGAAVRNIKTMTARQKGTLKYVQYCI
jgi:hypothetical protein